MIEPIGTLSHDLRKLYAANSVATTLTWPVPTTTKPSGNGILDARPNENSAEGLGNQAIVHFFGTTTANQTGSALLIGWNVAAANGVSLYVPTPLLLVDFTLGAATGVFATAIVGSGELLADTIAIASGGEFSESNIVISPENDSVAAVVVDLLGAALIEVRAYRGTAASVNALAKLL